MESTRKVVAMSQTSTNIKYVRSKPTLRGVMQTGSQPTSSTPRHPIQPPADGRTVDRWIRNLPATFPDVNQGVMVDLMLIVLRYLKEIEQVAANHQGAIEVFEELEYRKRFSLLIDGDSDLDRTLAEAPDVREQFVSNLTALVLILSTAITFFRPEYRQSLFEDTSRVVEQASEIAVHHLNQAVSYPPINIFDFLNATKTGIKSRIDNLYDLLPTTRHLVDTFDETEPRQVADSGVDKRRLLNSDKFIRQFRQFKIRGPRSELATASHSVEHSHRRHSSLSKSIKKQSYGSLDSISNLSLFSKSGTHSSTHPLTDTVTSFSPSEVDKTSSKPTDSNSTRPSLSCRKCRTTFNDPAEFEIHPCRSHSITSFRHWVVSLFSAHKSHSTISHLQLVKVWHSSDQYYQTYIAVIDTGSDESFISRAIVEQLHLDTRRTDPANFTPLGSLDLRVSERVQPSWQFAIGSRRHYQFPFFVVPELPGDIDMLLGNIPRKELGISLTSGALVVHEKRGDLSSLDLEQRLRGRQTRDCTASQNEKRQVLEARQADLVRQKEAANALENMKQGNLTSQKDAAGPGHDQR